MALKQQHPGKLSHCPSSDTSSKQSLEQVLIPGSRIPGVHSRCLRSPGAPPSQLSPCPMLSPRTGCEQVQENPKPSSPARSLSHAWLTTETPLSTVPASPEAVGTLGLVSMRMIHCQTPPTCISRAHLLPGTADIRSSESSQEARDGGTLPIPQRGKLRPEAAQEAAGGGGGVTGPRLRTFLPL